MRCRCCSRLAPGRGGGCMCGGGPLRRLVSRWARGGKSGGGDTPGQRDQLSREVEPGPVDDVPDVVVTNRPCTLPVGAPLFIYKTPAGGRSRLTVNLDCTIKNSNMGGNTVVFYRVEGWWAGGRGRGPNAVGTRTPWDRDLNSASEIRAPGAADRTCEPQHRMDRWPASAPGPRSIDRAASLRRTPSSLSERITTQPVTQPSICSSAYR